MTTDHAPERLVVHNHEARLAEELRRAGVEVGSVGGDHFRRVVANRLLASEWLDAYVASHTAALRADLDAALARLGEVRALDDTICDALMASRYGAYDGVSTERHLERLLDRFRAILDGPGKGEA